MTLQVSGPISLANIQAEFGGNPVPISLGDYYRGGTLVPAAVSTNIPVSGPIQLDDFYGTSKIIEPTIPVGGYLINRSGGPYSQISNGSNNPFLTAFDETINIDPLWDSRTWTFDGTVSSVANSCCFCWIAQVFVNGSLVMDAQSFADANSFFRSNSGTISLLANLGYFAGSNILTIKGGDVVRMYVAYRARNVAGTATASNMSANIIRTT